MNSNLLRNTIRKYSPGIKKVEYRNNAIIYSDNEQNKFVAKKNKNNILDLYRYLNSRGFDYLAELEFCNDEGYIYRYQKDILTPNEQKMSDLVKIAALLHNKTVYYVDVTLDEIKETFEKLNNKIDNTFNYYDDVITMIESNVYMSPSEYMLARNCNSIFSCLNFCKEKLNEWYEIMEKKSKKRIVLLHNKLDPNHLIKNKNNILISWDNASRDIPIYDFINLYKKNYSSYDFNELYREYKNKFPFLKEETILMYIILFIPDKIKLDSSELKNTIEVSKLCNYLYTTDKLFMENETKNSKIQDNNINE